jgi:hypothetical protein
MSKLLRFLLIVNIIIYSAMGLAYIIVNTEEKQEIKQPITVSLKVFESDGYWAAVTVRMDDGYKIYALDQGKLPDGSGPLATKIYLNTKLKRKWHTNYIYDMSQSDIWDNLEIKEYSGVVVWVASIEKPEEKVAGKITGQTCSQDSCMPFEIEFGE